MSKRLAKLSLTLMLPLRANLLQQCYKELMQTPDALQAMLSFINKILNFQT